jgi:ABC-type molybdate transport system permease subunit
LERRSFGLSRDGLSTLGSIDSFGHRVGGSTARNGGENARCFLLGHFFYVTLPLASSGILVGAILCFCRSLGEFGATITFVGNIAGETRTLPLAMYSLMQQPDTEQAVWRLIILSLTVAFLALWFAQWFHRYQKNKRGH